MGKYSDPRIMFSENFVNKIKGHKILVRDLLLSLVNYSVLA